MAETRPGTRPDARTGARTPARPSRRTALALGAAALLGGGSAASYPLLRRRGAAGVDGPALPAAAEAVWSTGPGGVLATDLVAAPAGTGLAYGGTNPGPLLRLREGDTARLTLRNATGAPSSLHVHGLPLDPAVDRPLETVPDGGTSVHEFPLVPGTAGIHWYHPHPHGDVSRQVSAGLAGALLVTGPLDELPELADCDDRVLVVTGGTTAGGELLVGGVRRPVLETTSGRTRLRVVNATSDDHLLLGLVAAGAPAPVHVLAVDGHPLTRVEPVPEFLLPPGGRVELLVDTAAPGRSELRALGFSPYADGGAGAPEQVLLALETRVRRTAPPLPARLPTTAPAHPATAPGAPVARRIVLDADPAGGFTVDGRAFDHERAASGPADVTARRGTVEVWEVVNEHTTDHPFHLHTHPFRVLQRDGAPVAPVERGWRDTVPVRPGESVRLAVEFSGPAGRTVFHCHVASHEDMGMMGVLDVLDAPGGAGAPGAPGAR
ncbi:multicopper oxidase family protein [Kineococcus gypseus]|uniref:multicopper oxidase family protein n=1 Tax=Kineococcus gypseus TaxID=1637102 RepID=UPI003D7EB6CD